MAQSEITILRFTNSIRPTNTLAAASIPHPDRRGGEDPLRVMASRPVAERSTVGKATPGPAAA